MLAITGNDTGIVRQLMANISVHVVDTLGNPVPDVTINFMVDSLPSGGSDYILSRSDTVTNVLGIAEASFTLGSKIGTYRIRAFNRLLRGSPVYFRILAQADIADTVIVVAGNQQTGTVGDTLSQNLQAQVVDQYSNPVIAVNVNWAASSNGIIDTVI